MKRRRPLPYWLTSGTEKCVGCIHLHVVEMVCHCIVCDRQVCLQCVARVGEAEEVFCPACLAEAGAG